MTLWERGWTLPKDVLIIILIRASLKYPHFIDKTRLLCHFMRDEKKLKEIWERKQVNLSLLNEIDEKLGSCVNFKGETRIQLSIVHSQSGKAINEPSIRVERLNYASLCRKGAFKFTCDGLGEDSSIVIGAMEADALFQPFVIFHPMRYFELIELNVTVWDCWQHANNRMVDEILPSVKKVIYVRINKY